MSADDWPVEVDEPWRCWLWVGDRDSRGYGRVGGARGKLAHREVWKVERGPCLAGLEPDHTCRRRNCVNPDHLEWVTRTENMRRRNWRYLVRRQECDQGHSLYDFGMRTPEAGIVCARCSGVR